MDANFRIEGEKIVLTPMTLDDAELYVNWRNSEFVMNQFIIKKPFTVEGQRAWITNKVLTDEVVQFVIWDKKDNVKIGSSYLINFDKENKRCEYGMLIGEQEYVGGGRGSEAAKLTSDYALTALPMYKVYCKILADNKASLRACEKAGFEIEGTFRGHLWIQDKPNDVCFLGKIKK